MKLRFGIVVLLVSQLVTPLGAQSPGQNDLGRGFRVPPTAAAHLANSTRIDALTRGGKLYLSLHDAIALALENNLDLELERYDLRIADTDVLRARAGSAPRGVPLSVHEGPSGVGVPSVNAGVTGPGTLGGGDIPALNGVVGTGTQTDLSIIGSLPLSTGPAVPDLDPTLSGSFRWNRSSDPQNSTFLPGLRSLNSDTVGGGVAFEKGFLSGATAKVGWDSLRQDINSPLLSYSPYVTSNLYVTVTQPLLRGAGIAVNNRYIRITKNNRTISDMVFRQQLMATVSAVVQLYWDLASWKEDAGVRQETLQSARQLLSDTQSAVAEGTLAPIDITRARAEVARRERDLSVSLTLVRQQSQVLLDYVTRGALKNEPASVEVVDHVEVPADESIPALPELLTQALSERPDLGQARLQLLNSQIALKGSRSALLPELNAFASTQSQALTGSPNVVANSPVLTGTSAFAGAQTDPLFLGGYGDSVGQVFKHNFPSYEVGLEFSIPLSNRAARADAARDQLQTRQQEIRLRQLEKRTHLELTNAVLAIQQARASYTAATNERLLQQQTVEAEREKLAVGNSTTYLVMQYQGDLAQAKSAEIAARNDYMKAKTALQRALGTILTSNNVSVSEGIAGVMKP
jgi:outer membrane protein